jgi:uncharacterized protein
MRAGVNPARPQTLQGTLAMLFLAAALAAAQEAVPPPPARYFNDYAGVVASSEARRLEEKLKRFDEETSSQVVVAIFPELPAESLEDFTVRTAESWKVGRKELDNGAVLFVFVNDRKMRLEVGYGLEGALPDATAKRIIEDVIAPRFRNGRYGEGVEAGVDAILAATRGEYTAPPRKPGGTDGGALALLVPIGFIALIFILSRRLDRPLGPLAGHRRRRGGFWYIGPGGFGGGGGGGGGWGGGGGGGFGGGGGSFGGGGASGSW